MRAIVAGGLGSQDDWREETGDQPLLSAMVLTQTYGPSPFAGAASFNRLSYWSLVNGECGLSVVKR